MTLSTISPDEQLEIDKLAGNFMPMTPQAMGVEDGIQRFGRELGAWNPPLLSPDQEILPVKEDLDARTRDIIRNDGYVQAGATIHKDSIVGSLYTLNAKPIGKVLGMSDGWEEEFQEEVETLFTLWAESPLKWVDNSAQNDFTSLIRLGVGVNFTGGELLATVEYDREQIREFHTAIQMIDPDRLTTPTDRTNDPLVRGGIEHDAKGRHVTAFIRTGHPMDWRAMMMNAGKPWYKPVPFRKPWGRQQVIYLREQLRPDQTRAVSDIVAGLKEMAITRKFRDVVLQNAVVGAMYAATIESELPSQAVYEQLGGTAGGATVDYATAFLQAVSAYSGAAKGLQIDGARIPHLFPGTKLQLRPAGSPGGVGQDFEKSLLRYVAATLNVSYEELSRDFSDANYASMKAGVALTRRFMGVRKRFVADAFANHIYRCWLEEAVNNDHLTTFPKRLAPRLYYNNHLSIRFDALARADWIGASLGQIDELKETQAAVLRLKSGLGTYEDELARLGKDWRRTIPQLGRELKLLEENGVVVQEDNSVNAASGSPREARDDQ